MGGLYVALGKYFTAKAWDKICRRLLLWDNLPTRIHKSVCLHSELEPMGETIVEDKIQSSTIVVVLCKLKK